MRPDGPRDPIAGPDSGPEPPFPIRLSGPVIKGFGRGSKELGIPTANIPADGLSAYPDLQSGVYYGVAALDPARFNHGPDGAPRTKTPARATIFPCVLSIGYNPFYKNTVRSVEIHILPHLSPTSPPSTSDGRPKFHHFPDFYGTPLNLLILGHIRPEYDYVSLEALVEDIRIDCEVAKASLAREAYAVYMDNGDTETEASKAVESDRQWLRTF
ncbi:hypothetical protein VTO42DRAFT_8646 [Malbranchea cinnamomea]